MAIKLKSVVFVMGCLLVTSLYAQNNHVHKSHPDEVTHNTSAATAELMSAMDKMHGPMMEGIKATDPDRAFIEGMIPHHQGAIDMANIVIKYGKDPEVRKLAEEIIKAQESEIAWMQQWLKDHPVKK